MKWYFGWWNCILKLDGNIALLFWLTFSHWKFHQNSINENCNGKELNCNENVFIHPYKIHDNKKSGHDRTGKWIKLIFSTKNDAAPFIDFWGFIDGQWLCMNLFILIENITAWWVTRHRAKPRSYKWIDMILI